MATELCDEVEMRLGGGFASCRIRWAFEEPTAKD